MGEDAGYTAGDAYGNTRRVTIAEAARILGVKEPAIRKRIQRGTLDHDKGEDGRTYVYLDAGIDAGIPEPPAGQEERQLRYEELKDQISYLRGQLAEEREARRRADTIIAQLTQANATLAGRVPELEAPQRPSESSVSASAGPEGDSGPEPRGGPQRPIARPWWRRWFGG